MASGKLTPVMTSNLDFQTFLLGVWHVQRSLTYRAGGYTGKFVGRAKVEPLANNANTLLYHEQGLFTSTDRSKVLDTFQRYAFNCERVPMKVFFVERVVASSVELGGHFVDIGFHGESGECSFTHLCGSDVYSGTWTLLSYSAFRWSWQIRGPRKDGEISTLYTRLDSKSSSVDVG